MSKNLSKKLASRAKKIRRVPLIGVGCRAISKYSSNKLKSRRRIHLRIKKFMEDVKKTNKDTKKQKAFVEPSFYPLQVVRRSHKLRKTPRKSTVEKLRKSIKLGTVLILLTTKHRGKRVIFLKQLKKSGLLLVTGPYKLNKVPLKRIHQSQVIATSTRIPLNNNLNLEKFDDKYFNDLKKTITKDNNERKKKISPEMKVIQNSVDKDVLAAVRKIKFMRKYLSSKFSLRRGQYPHQMIF